MSSKPPIVCAELENLQRETFGYFLPETNPANGLVIGKTTAVERTLATLRFFWNSPQGPEHSPSPGERAPEL